MHRSSPAPLVDLRLEGSEPLLIGRLRLQALHTPGHNRDSTRPHHPATPLRNAVSRTRRPQSVESGVARLVQARSHRNTTIGGRRQEWCVIIAPLEAE